MLDHVRRVAAVVLTALVLLAVPQIAQAAFTGRAAPQLNVGTARLQAPSNLELRRMPRCENRGISVEVADFDFTGPATVVFRYAAYRNGSSTPYLTQTSDRRDESLSTGRLNGPRTSWRLGLRAEVGGWTGPEFLSPSFEC